MTRFGYSIDGTNYAGSIANNVKTQGQKTDRGHQDQNPIFNDAKPVILVKLDVEGAEIEALLGMRSLIERNRPGLAICVYRKPDDIIRIPALIKSWKLPYRLYLRAHCWNTFDTVLYAVPE